MKNVVKNGSKIAMFYLLFAVAVNCGKKEECKPPEQVTLANVTLEVDAGDTVDIPFELPPTTTNAAGQDWKDVSLEIVGGSHTANGFNVTLTQFSQGVVDSRKQVNPYQFSRPLVSGVYHLGVKNFNIFNPMVIMYSIKYRDAVAQCPK